MKGSFPSGDDGKLSRLLQLKRFETPTDGEWEEFDRSFGNRRLSAMGVRRRGGLFLLLRSWLNFRRVVYSVGMLSLCTVLAVAVARHGGFAARELVARCRTNMPIKFPDDSMHAAGIYADGGFGVSSMNYSSGGVYYVRDAIVAAPSGERLPLRM
jgi:hypothetical protein